MSDYKMETKCVQSGYTPGNGEPRQIPVIQSTTFKYATSEDMGKLFDLEASGYFYSRLQNPTCDTVAAKIADMEGGTAAERMENVSRQAQQLNEAPYALSFFPDGEAGVNTQAAQVEGDGVLLTALRPSQDGKSLIVRLFESTGEARKAKIRLPLLNAEAEVELGAFEICTLRADKERGAVEPAGLLE